MKRIPIKVAPTRTPLKKPDWIRIRLPSDNRVAELKGKLRHNRLYTVCEEASCPKPVRMFRPRHRDVHDHGRHLHPPLPLLRRRPRPAAGPGRRRARVPGPDHPRHGTQIRGHHLGRPGRPARRRGGAFRRLHPRGEGDESGHPAGDPGARFQGPHGPGAGGPVAAPARRVQPQTSKRCRGSTARLGPAPTISGRWP